MNNIHIIAIKVKWWLQEAKTYSSLIKDNGRTNNIKNIIQNIIAKQRQNVLTFFNFTYMLTHHGFETKYVFPDTIATFVGIYASFYIKDIF